MMQHPYFFKIEIINQDSQVPIFLKLIATMASDNTPAAKSAIGPAYNMPSMPKNFGIIKSNGRKISPCLDNERKIPCFTLPVLVK